MKQSQWNEGLNNLDSDIIENYVAQKEAYLKKNKKPIMWPKYIAVAATICLVFGAFVTSLALNRADEPEPVPEKTEETTEETTQEQSYDTETSEVTTKEDYDTESSEATTEEGNHDTEVSENTTEENCDTEDISESQTVGGVVTEVTSEGASETESEEDTTEEQNYNTESAEVTTEEVTSAEETVVETVTTEEATSDEETVAETIATEEATSDEETVAETIATAEMTSNEETVTTEQPTETEEVTEPDTSINVEETSQTSEETTEAETKTSKYTALEFNVSDSGVGANHNIDIKLGTTIYNNIPKEQVQKVAINGILYEANYEKSQRSYLYKEDVDFYRSVDDTYIIEFGVNKNTGVVDNCRLVNKKYLSSKDDSQKLNQDECTKIAYQILEQYVNLEEYTLTLIQKDYRTTGGRYDIYEYWFYRIIDGVKTNDKAYIVITEYGDLYGYQFNCLGEMKDATVPTKEELSDMKVAIDAKVNSIYANVKKLYAVEYEIRDEYLIMLEDGKYAMEYVVDVNLTPNDPEGLKLIEKISLLVYV